MPDFLDKLAKDSRETIESGYYEKMVQNAASKISLKKAICQSKGAPVITEIKSASPSKGIIRTDFEPAKVAQAMARGGAVGISVLTEPKNFKGSLMSLEKTRQAVQLPILMKDIVLSSKQLEAASNAGANAVLLIQALFDREYCECDVKDMILKAHSLNLEVLLEAHSKAEFRQAICSEAELIGINNRNLGTLEIDLNVTKSILYNDKAEGRIIISESGIESADSVSFLRKCGADAFLVGSAVMLADNVEEKVRELATAY